MFATNRIVTKLAACKRVQTPPPTAVHAFPLLIDTEKAATPRLQTEERASGAWRGVYWPGLRDGRCARHGELVGAFTALCYRCHLEQLDAAARGSRSGNARRHMRPRRPSWRKASRERSGDLADCADLAAGSGVGAVSDVRGFYASIGVVLPQRKGSNVSVRCFTAPDKHRRGDRSPSCSVSVVTGAYNCFVCAAKGGPYDAALACGLTPAEIASSSCGRR